MAKLADRRRGGRGGYPNPARVAGRLVWRRHNDLVTHIDSATRSHYASDSAARSHYARDSAGNSTRAGNPSNTIALKTKGPWLFRAAALVRLPSSPGRLCSGCCSLPDTPPWGKESIFPVDHRIILLSLRCC